LPLMHTYSFPTVLLLTSLHPVPDLHAFPTRRSSDLLQLSTLNKGIQAFSRPTHHCVYYRGIKRIIRHTDQATRIHDARNLPSASGDKVSHPIAESSCGAPTC